MSGHDINGASKPEQEWGDELTAKQRMFCAEYLVDLNAAQAAIRAGYSEATAKEMGYENLTKPHIHDCIQKLMDERRKRVRVSADDVLMELKRMAFYDPADIARVSITCPEDILKLPEDVRRCIIGWGYDKAGNFTLKLSGKTQQLEMIGRHLKMFTDKSEITGRDGEPLNQAVALSEEQMAQVERIRERREASKDQRS